MDDRQRERIAAELRTFEAELGLPNEFLDRLVLEDDWSFVIKSHALIEATITHLLTTAVDARLGGVFKRLEISNTQVGKLVFAEALGLVGTTEGRFIRQFSELRNKLVHDVRQVSFSFEAHLRSLDKNQSSAFAEAVAGFVDAGPPRDLFKSLFFQEPRVAIWTATMQILARALAEAKRAKAMAVLKEMATADWGRTQ